MDYLSCFSGIGGFEMPGLSPTLCEIDADCRDVLKKMFPEAKIYSDINQISEIKTNIICGGWPCQDISVAGKQRGLKGDNSRLFYSLVNLAKNAGTTTVVAENVPNLLKMQNGDVFREVLKTLFETGFTKISWRVINARSFGLPHHRNRVFMIASKEQDIAFSIFRDFPKFGLNVQTPASAGFYWTAGTHSLNYSMGYVPTLKIGSSIGIPSPPAIHYNGIVRQLHWQEALKLQGFDLAYFSDVRGSVALKMAGNAVAKPVGEFVMTGVTSKIANDYVKFKNIQSDWLNEGLDGSIPASGFYDGEIHEPMLPLPQAGSNSLDEFINMDANDRLSKRAAIGLLKRLDKSGIPCPNNLREDLEELSKQKNDI